MKLKQEFNKYSILHFVLLHKKLVRKTAKVIENIENVHKIRYDRNSVKHDEICNGRKEKTF